MKKPSKKTIIIIGSAILLIFILRMVKSRIENGGEGNKTPPPIIPTSNASIIPIPSGTKTPPALNNNCDHSTFLKKGEKSLCVQYAQKQINLVASKLGISKLTEDGIFGSKTEAAFVKLLGKKTGTYKEIVDARKFIQ